MRLQVPVQDKSARRAVRAFPKASATVSCVGQHQLHVEGAADAMYTCISLKKKKTINLTVPHSDFAIARSQIGPWLLSNHQPQKEV